MSAAPQRGRGRPTKETLGDLQHGPAKFVMEVRRQVAAAGGQRGAEAAAIRDVAQKNGLSPAWLKDTVQHFKRRHLELPEIAEQSQAIRVNWAELARRLSGCPDDVLSAVGGLPPGAFLRLLRAQNIDQTCPPWLVRCVRSRGEQAGHDLMQLLEQAAQTER